MAAIVPTGTPDGGIIMHKILRMTIIVVIKLLIPKRQHPGDKTKEEKSEISP